MEEKPVTIWAREALFARRDRLPDELVEKILNKYEFRFYEEKSCQSCEFLFERPGPMCEDCAANKGSALLAREVNIDGVTYLKMPIGSADDSLDLFDDYKVKYKLKADHPRVPMSRKITFTATLRDYQRQVVDAMHRERRGVVKSPPRSGKCIVGDSLIMTEDGIVPIQSLFSGYHLSDSEETVIETDKRIGTSVGERRVSHLYSKVVDHTVKISTKTGYCVRGTPNHKVQVLNRNFDLAWVRLDEIKAGDYVVVSRKAQWLPSGNSLLPASDCTYRTPTKLTPELARLLGYWVANGSLSVPGRIGISSNNPAVQEDFMACITTEFPDVNAHVVEQGAKVGGVYAQSIPVWSWLQEACGLTCGVAREKSIPTVLLQADRALMLEFLSAYISCDACIANDGIELCSASSILIDQLHTVLSFLGIIGTKGTRRSFARNGAHNDREYYELWIHLNEARVLLDQLKIRKQYSLKEIEVTNQRDVIPFAREFLRDLPQSHKKWMAATNSDLHFAEVTEVHDIHDAVRVYDVCVPGDHHFIANGIVNHNTVCGAAFICEVGEKAIVLASQKEWLDGFKETFIGSKTQPPMTDCLPSQIGYCKKPEDFDKYDVCLVTPQTFIRHPEWLDIVYEKASVVIVDEVRLSAAPKYAKVVASLNTRHYIGLDGTPSRSKDGRFVLVENLIGPIIARPVVPTLSPKIKLVRTNFKRNYKMGVPWNKMVDDLEHDEDRLKLIAKWAIMDAKHNHMVLIPMARVDAIRKLVNEINHQAGEILAKPFTGDLPKKVREETLQEARQYKVKILVGTTKLLSVGTNIPRASCLYDVTMSSNIENCQQRNRRTLTPYDGKPNPILRIFMDNMSVRKRCLSNEYWQVIKPLLKPIIKEEDEAILKEYLADRKSSSFSEPGEDVW